MNDSKTALIVDERDDGAFIPSYLDDFGLSPFEFRLYSHIARRAGGRGQCWEGVDKMAKNCKMERKTAYKAFQFLEDHKMIRVERRKGATSLVTLTNKAYWIAPDQDVESDRPIKPPHPLKGTSNKKKSGCAINGTGTGHPKYGTSGIPNTEHLPVPNTVQPPIPNTVHKGIPLEVTPIEVNPPKKEKEILESFSFSPSDKDQESEQSENFPHAQNSDPNIEDPQTPKPLSPVAPENIGKPVKREAIATASDIEDRKAVIKPLLGDDAFLRYLFGELKRLKEYFEKRSDMDYEKHSKTFLRIGYENSERGDRRFDEVQDFIEAYDRHKAEQARIEQDRLEREREKEAHVPMSPEVARKYAEMGREIKRKSELNALRR